MSAHIRHGTADNFIQCSEGSKTWNIECLVTEVCDIKQLEGRPKLFFIEACRGKESNLTNVMMTKSGSLPPQMGISLPSKQDVFVGNVTPKDSFIRSNENSKGLPPCLALSPSPPWLGLLTSKLWPPT